jgi:hypothetical protein
MEWTRTRCPTGAVSADFSVPSNRVKKVKELPERALMWPAIPSSTGQADAIDRRFIGPRLSIV